MIDVRPAGDGWRVVTRCADGCGAEVVCLPAFIGAARCIDCGRRHHGAAVPRRPPPGWTRRNGLPLGQPGRSMPGALRPVDLAVKGGKATGVRRGLVEEWAAGDPRMPSGARGVLAVLNGRGRVAHTIAIASDGTPVETVGVHLPGRAVALFVRRDVAASVTPRKVDLKRTKTGRRKVQRFDPIVRPARTDWPGSALVRQGGALRSMTVTKLVQMIRDGEL